MSEGCKQASQYCIKDLKNGRTEDRPAIQVSVQIGVEGVGTLVGQSAFYRSETEIKDFLKKKDMTF